MPCLMGLKYSKRFHARIYFDVQIYFNGEPKFNQNMADGQTDGQMESQIISVFLFFK